MNLILRLKLFIPVMLILFTLETYVYPHPLKRILFTHEVTYAELRVSSKSSKMKSKHIKKIGHISTSRISAKQVAKKPAQQPKELHYDYLKKTSFHFNSFLNCRISVCSFIKRYSTPAISAKSSMCSAVNFWL